VAAHSPPRRRLRARGDDGPGPEVAAALAAALDGPGARGRPRRGAEAGRPRRASTPLALRSRSLDGIRRCLLPRPASAALDAALPALSAPPSRPWARCRRGGGPSSCCEGCMCAPPVPSPASEDDAVAHPVPSSSSSSSSLAGGADCGDGIGRPRALLLAETRRAGCRLRVTHQRQKTSNGTPLSPPLPPPPPAGSNNARSRIPSSSSGVARSRPDSLRTIAATPCLSSRSRASMRPE
jgi:hypothetical protein